MGAGLANVENKIEESFITKISIGLRIFVFGLWAYALIVFYKSLNSWGNLECWIWLAEALLIAFIGYLIFFIAAKLRFSAEEKRLSLQYPKQAWLWRADWFAGFVDPRWQNYFVFQISVGFIMVAILGLPIYWFKTGEFQNLPSLVYIIFIFPLVGLLVILSGIMGLLRWRKFGKTRLQLLDRPIAQGYSSKVRLMVGPRPLSVEQDLEIKVQSLNITTTGQNKNKSTKTLVLWENQFKIKILALSGGSYVDFHVEIPFDSKPHNIENPANQVVWTLHAYNEQTGINFQAEFDLPVFLHQGKSNTGWVNGELPQQKKTILNMDSKSLQWMQCFEGFGPALHIKQRMFRAPLLHFAIFIFSFCFMSIAYLLILKAGELVASVIGFVFGLFALLFLLFFIVGFCVGRELRVTGREVQVSIIFLIFRFNRKYLFQNIQKVLVVNTVSNGSQIYYSVKIQTRLRRLGGIVVADLIGNRNEAEWLAARLRELINTSVENSFKNSN